MSERSIQSKKWAQRAGATAALVGVIYGVQWYNAHEQAAQPSIADKAHHNPAIAGPALADRIGNCALTITDTHRAFKGTALGPNDVVDYTMDIKFKPQAQPYYAAFVNDNGVEWQNNAYITRSHEARASKDLYLPVATMYGAADAQPTLNGKATDKRNSQANGIHVDGMLVPQTRYTEGSFVDIWANESTTYLAGDHMTSSVNAVYCGRMALNDAAGKPTWQLDKNAHQPLHEAHAQVVPQMTGPGDQDLLLLPLR